MITIHVRYFAALRDRAGITSESVETEFRTVGEFARELIERRNLGVPVRMIRVAVNGNFADDHAELQDGDEVVLIPPVAGG